MFTKYVNDYQSPLGSIPGQDLSATLMELTNIQSRSLEMMAASQRSQQLPITIPIATGPINTGNKGLDGDEDGVLTGLSDGDLTIGPPATSCGSMGIMGARSTGITLTDIFGFFSGSFSLGFFYFWPCLWAFFSCFYLFNLWIYC